MSALETLLKAAVRDRMVADVPLGAFLSGGIDSSLVVALMQAQSPTPIKTFTVSFAENDYDEASAAREVAHRLGTDHTEVRVTAAEARDVIPSLPSIYDEPFADASQIPTWHLSRVARRAVTVALSGDGGDEVFGGYGRYFLAHGLEKRIRSIPRPFRRVAATAIGCVPLRSLNGVLRRVGTKLPHGYRGRLTGDRLHKLSSLMLADSGAALYQAMLDVGTADVLLVEAQSSGSREISPWPRIPTADLIHEMMCEDTGAYLPDDVLTKVDRASMSVSLEVRAPILDHRVVEFAWRLPLKMKVREGVGKLPLRLLLERYLPEGSATRTKQGFGVPIADWLRGPLRVWGEELLGAQRLSEDGIFDPTLVRSLWTSHLGGRYNWATALWSILMFQAWSEQWQTTGRPSRFSAAA